MATQTNGILGSVHQMVNQRVRPFDIAPISETPNEETRRALAAAEAKERGLILDDAPAFNDADNLMTFLEKE